MKKILFVLLFVLPQISVFSQIKRPLHSVGVGAFASYGSDLYAHGGIHVDLSVFNFKLLMFHSIGDNIESTLFQPHARRQRGALIGYNVYNHVTVGGNFYIFPVAGFLLREASYKDLNYGKAITKHDTTRYPIGCCFNYVGKRIYNFPAMTLGVFMTTRLCGINLGVAF